MTVVGYWEDYYFGAQMPVAEPETTKQCSLCKKHNLKPRERKINIFYECANCDSPTGIDPEPITF